VLDLREVALREERRVRGVARLDEPADLGASQAGDPAASLDLAQLVDLRAREHAPVADDHEASHAELAAHRLDLVGDGGRIGRVARVDAQGDGTTVAIREQAVDDARELEPVAVVPPLRQRTVAAMVGAARHVVEDHRPLAEVAGGELALDEGLALQQPVQGRVERVLVDALHAELLGERGLPEERGALQLRARTDDSLRDHRQHRLALGAGLGADELGHAQALHGQLDRAHMPAGQAARHGEVLAGLHETAAAEHDAQRGHRLLGQRREVGEGALEGAASVADAFAQQHGGRGVAVGDYIDVHGRKISHNFIISQGEIKINNCITWALLERQMLRLAGDKPISRRPLRKVHP